MIIAFKKKNNLQKVLNENDLLKICDILPKLGILEMDKKQQKKTYKRIKSIIKDNDKIKLINFFGLNTSLQKCPAASSIIHLEPNGN